MSVNLDIMMENVKQRQDKFIRYMETSLISVLSYMKQKIDFMEIGLISEALSSINTRHERSLAHLSRFYEECLIDIRNYLKDLSCETPLNKYINSEGRLQQIPNDIVILDDEIFFIDNATLSMRKSLDSSWQVGNDLHIISIFFSKEHALQVSNHGIIYSSLIKEFKESFIPDPRILHDFKKEVFKAAYNEQLHRILLMFSDFSLKILHLNNLEVSKTKYCESRFITFCAITAEFIILASLDRSIDIYACATLKQIKRLKTSSNICSFAVSEKIIAVGTEDLKLNLLDYHEKRKKCEIILHPRSTCLHISSESKYLFSGLQDGSINVYDLQNMRLLRRFPGNNSAIIKIISTKLELITITDDKMIRFWNFTNIVS